MPIPGYDKLLLPVLKAVANGEVSGKQIREQVGAEEHLTETDLNELLPKGRQTVFSNRVAIANMHLQVAKLIEKTDSGFYRASEAGRKLLADPPLILDEAYLDNFPSHAGWRRGLGARVPRPPTMDTPLTPEELIARNIVTLSSLLEAEILDRIRKITPAAFEQLVVDLLSKLGYGSGDSGMSRRTGGPGDGGIDGIIKQDALGLDVVYIQAKRYAEGYAVGRPEVQAFAGSLDGVGATKGVFITTSTFSSGAVDYAIRITKRIILVNGIEFAKLMVEREVGVRVAGTYTINKIDENYFTEQ